MNRSAPCTLADVLVPRSEIVHPRDKPVGNTVFVGLEHIESGTGRRVGSLPIRLEELTGRKSRFHPGDIVYGYLRPYLNKVWVADFEGYCSVDQYVFDVADGALAEFVAAFMRSPTFLSKAPVSETPGQLPRIRLGEILAVPIAMPPLEEQHRIAAEIRSQADETSKLQRSSGVAREGVGHLSNASRDEFMERLPIERVPIGSIVSTPGSIIDGPFGSNLKTDHYQASGVRVIRLGNIGVGRFIDVDRAFVAQEHADHLHRHRADAGDVVVAALGDGVRPAGRACLVPPGLGPSIVKADCFRVRTDGSSLEAAFLMHVLNSPQTLAIVEATTRGATRPRMNLEMLKNLEVPIPAVDDQRRLVAILEERLALIGTLDESLRVEQEAIDALPSAWLRRAFGGPAA